MPVERPSGGSRTKRRLLVAIVVIVGALFVVAVISNGGFSTHKAPLTYCSAIGDLGDAMLPWAQGRLTPSEFSDQLASVEDDLNGAALLFDDASQAATVRNLAVAVGRAKVAASIGVGLNSALNGIVTALDSAPRNC